MRHVACAREECSFLLCFWLSECSRSAAALGSWRKWQEYSLQKSRDALMTEAWVLPFTRDGAVRGPNVGIARVTQFLCRHTPRGYHTSEMTAEEHQSPSAPCPWGPQDLCQSLSSQNKIPEVWCSPENDIISRALSGAQKMYPTSMLMPMIFKLQSLLSWK